MAMLKKIVTGGLLGGVVLIACMFLSDGLFGLRSGIEMNRLVNEGWVYEILKESIDEPGGYTINPPMEDPTGPFPTAEPVFSIHYSGLGHGAAGRIFLVNLAIAFMAPMIGAWMLSITSERILSSYARRVLFFAAIGLLLALFSDLMRYDIGAYALHHALMFAAQDFVSWTLAGLAVAWCVRSEAGAAHSA
jgi:hypothetical protein